MAAHQRHRRSQRDGNLLDLPDLPLPLPAPDKVVTLVINEQQKDTAGEVPALTVIERLPIWRVNPSKGRYSPAN